MHSDDTRTQVIIREVEVSGPAGRQNAMGAKLGGLRNDFFEEVAVERTLKTGSDFIGRDWKLEVVEVRA